jgi:hypothetical protein
VADHPDAPAEAVRGEILPAAARPDPTTARALPGRILIAGINETHRLRLLCEDPTIVSDNMEGVGVMHDVTQASRTRRAIRMACVLASAMVLAGCVVVPAYGPHWHPYYYH